MKLAVLSDIHANLPALEACIAHASGLGATQLALLGDLVGYGGEPAAVVSRVQQLVAAGAWVVQGNHDQMAVDPPADVRRVGQATARWTHEQLSPEQRAFLAALPLTRLEQACLLVHASAETPERWPYVEDSRSAARCLAAAHADFPGVRRVFVGHVHRQSLYYRGAGSGLMDFTPTPGVVLPMPRQRPWLATVGSVGQPRDGSPQAMYALFDSAAERLSFQRVSYDVAAAAAAIRRAGLDGALAIRLEEGH